MKKIFIPNILAFNWKRCLFRTCVMAVLLLIGQSLPSFGAILSLLGGSTVTIITFVLPPILYIFAMDGSESRYAFYAYRQVDCLKQNISINLITLYKIICFCFRKLNIFERIYCYILIFIGVMGGISSTYSAINEIANNKFELPCYLQ